MKLYLVWESSRGGKDLSIIYDNLRKAKAFCKGYNDRARETNFKCRAYIVEYDDEKNYGFYDHKELKED